MPEPTDQELLKLILRLEDELLAQGMDPKARAFELPIRAMNQLGYVSVVVAGRGSPEIFHRIRRIQKTLYRTKDVAGGALHGGAFMFRGIAAAVHIPVIYGRVGINPFDFTDLAPQQVKWLQSDPKQAGAYVSTFADLFDFAACLAPFSGYTTPTDPARNLLRLAAFQMQAAGATLCAAFDERGAIQSALISTELSLKAALAGKGKTDRELKSYGHDRSKLVKDVGELYGGFELMSVQARMQLLPDLIPNRYSKVQPTRMETGEIVMASQYIAGAVARAVTGGSLRRSLKMN